MYTLNDRNEFVIENFQRASPFASFLPGIAGKDGIPMWVFYVNRGQGIAGFGIHNKDSSISEFFPADKAYQNTPLQGFRTFIKLLDNDNGVILEPFTGIPNQVNVTETLTIGENHVQLEYVHAACGITVTVEYYTLPHAPLAGLIREVTIKNNRTERLPLEMADGLASIFPSGVGNAPYKELGNTMKSWFDVDTVDELFNFYHLRGSTSDDAHVANVHDGNFYASLIVVDEKESIVRPVYDRSLIFGEDLTLQHPLAFQRESVSSLMKKSQVSTNKVSSGFTMHPITLDAGATLKLFTVIGYGENKKKIKAFVNNAFCYENMLAYKHQAKKLTEELTQPVKTNTAVPKFDAYMKQNYLDNGLRGGFPTIFRKDNKHAVFYLYSRKHGDLERDYNFFSISPTYYSQGNGNYRDINQNRRLDVLFHPEVMDYNIRHFVNLIQLDGYNPLAVKEVRYKLRESIIDFSKFGIGEPESTALLDIICKPFTPGDMLKYIQDANVQLTVPFSAFLTEILLQADESLEAVHGEGFWVDHWTYNLDLIDSFIDIYPDKIDTLFFDGQYRFFASPASVNKRVQRYVDDNGSIKQYDAVEVRQDEQCVDREQWVKGAYGNGTVYETNLYSKLLLLAANKTACLSPFGLGIEMEAGKPGWNDALNGLPGMFGASTSELYELQRLLRMLVNVSTSTEETIILPEETGSFITDLALCIREGDVKALDASDTAHRYWDTVSTIKEQFRAKVKQGISGENIILPLSEAKELVHIYLEQVNQALTNVDKYKQNDLVPTYFYFEANRNLNNVISFEPYAVTSFLEGVVKKLKLSSSREEAVSIYDAVRRSELYDKKLQMYKTSMSISEEPIGLGRAKFFTRGWLENESVFMHMEYKYLLELLRSGLYDQFYNDMQTALVPFLDPAIYGRSILENSSFIASSANPDESLHGKGFVARLTGATVECLHMWWVMFTGGHVFTFDEQKEELTFRLDPKLAEWFFKSDGTASFTLFSHIAVTYHNDSGRNCFGTNGVQAVRYTIVYENGDSVVVEGSNIKGRTALDIRNGSVTRIYVELQ